MAFFPDIGDLEPGRHPGRAGIGEVWNNEIEGSQPFPRLQERASFQDISYVFQTDTPAPPIEEEAEILIVDPIGMDVKDSPAISRFFDFKKDGGRQGETQDKKRSVESSWGEKPA